MKKFYSIFALVAMLCTSMFVATSCGSDDEPEAQKDKIIVNAIYDQTYNAQVLSKTADNAVSQAMHAVQESLGKIELTTSEAAEKLLKETVDRELNKLANDVKFELKVKGAILYFSVQKTSPVVEYKFDCRYLETTPLEMVITIKSVKAFEGGLNNMSAETVELLNEAVEKLNTLLPGKTVNTNYTASLNDIFALATSSLPAELVSSLLATTDASTNPTIPVIYINYTSDWIGHNGAEQTAAMSLNKFKK